MDYNKFDNINKKLLKFSGFKTKDTELYYPNGHKARWGHLWPDLVNDPRNQIKWIYPELGKRKLRIEFRKDYDDSFKPFPFYWTILDGHSIVGYGEDLDKPALAFALACEKYIDSLEKSNGFKRTK